MTEQQSPYEKPTLDKDLDRLGLIESATQFVLSRAVGPGLALIFLCISAITASTVVAPGAGGLLIVLAAVLAAYLAMNIGANDVTNNVGAAVGARAISMTGALLVAAFAEIAGALLAGGNVVSTIKNDIIDPAMIDSSSMLITIMLSALLASALWINIATWINAPVSTTHSVVGAIMGATLVVAGPDAIGWPSLAGITASWIVSPIMGGAIAAGFLWFIKDTIIYREDKIAAARRWVPLLLALMTGSFLAYLILIGAPRFADFHVWQALLIGTVFAGGSHIWFKDIVARQSEGLENRNQSLKILFRVPLILAAALLSFAHGANDVSNAIGPLAAIVDASGTQWIAHDIRSPFWVVVIGALGISLGLLLFGPRLIRVVGGKITRLNPLRAYCVAMSAAVTVILASAIGMPVSSTHVAIGAVFGVGFFREWYTARSLRRRRIVEQRAEQAGITMAPQIAGEADEEDGSSAQVTSSKYRYLVRRSYVLSIMAAWVVTVPVSGLLAAIAALLLPWAIN